MRSDRIDKSIIACRLHYLPCDFPFKILLLVLLVMPITSLPIRPPILDPLLLILHDLLPVRRLDIEKLEGINQQLCFHFLVCFRIVV